MFSNQIKELIENELFNTNYGRVLILKKFEEIISKCDFNTNLKVCVIGGSVKEPEILLLRKLGFNLNITTFGIEDTDDVFFDLNQTNKLDNIESFDLILCGQVLEHIWNIQSFVENIIYVMNSKSLCFIHCPKSNIHHGHTYYSSGYSKEFLKEIFTDKIELIEFGELGTPRLYTSIHLLKDWISTREAQSGKINFRTWFSFLWNLNGKKPKTVKGFRFLSFKLSYKKFLINSLLKRLSNIEDKDKLVKTESFIFFKLNN